MMMSLYEVGVEGLELEIILSANDGELTPELELRLDSFLKSGKEKINAACMVVRSLDASAKACVDEAKRMSDRAGSFSKDCDRLKSRILGAVDAAFDGKVKTDLFTVWGQSSAATFAVDIEADCDLKALHAVDPDLVKVGYSLDKAKCRELIKAGIEIVGVTVIENPGTRYLRIK
jgi:hypothetical protein